MLVKQVKVKCPICRGVKKTRYDQFRCCGIQHKTEANIFYGNTTQNKNEDTKDTKDTTQVKPLTVPKEDKVTNTTKDTNDTKDTTIPKGTKGTEGTKGIKVTLIDEDTKEVLLSTNAAIVMSPNETLFSGEVETTCKRYDNKDNPSNNLPIDNPAPINTNPTGLLDKVGKTIENPFVQGIALIGVGAVVTQFMKKRENKAKAEDTNW